MVTEQTGFRFAGHFRSPFGGLATFPEPNACLESGDFNGSVDGIGQVTSLQFNIVLGGSRDCVAISRPIFAGEMVWPITLLAEATDVIECFSLYRPTRVERTLRLVMNGPLSR